MILAFGTTVKPYLVLFRYFHASKQGVRAKNISLRLPRINPTKFHESPA